MAMKKFFLLSIFIGSLSFSLAQNVGVDVATPQQKLDVAGALKIGSTTTGVAGSLRWTGTAFQFHDGTQWITLNANTDDQVLDVIQLNGTNLEISVENDGQATHSVDLSSFLDNTDAQQFDQVTINGSNQLLLSISNDGQATHVLDLSGYLDNTDEQRFDVVQLSGTNLELSLQNDGVATHVIDLSSLAVDTDDQAFDVAQLVGSNLELSLEDDGVATEVIDLSGFLDNTDDQKFDVINITADQLRLSLESDAQPTHVLDLSPYKDNTDDQKFDVVQLVGNSLQLSLEDDGQATHSIDLSGFADNTDDQTIDVLSLAGNTLNLSLENDGQANQTLDLSQFLDNTDNQQLNGFSISGNILSLDIEDAGGIQTVNLAPYLDNTDNQEITQFNLSGNTLQLTLEDDAGGQETVDLSGYLDNTDDQAVTTFSLSGTDLQLQVEDDAGGLQTVDLDPLRRALVDDDGDTKVEVEATADEDQIRLSTGGGEAMRINSTQQVGIGLSTGIQNRLVVQGSNSDARAVLGLRGGNAVTTFNGGPQIAFGYDGDDSYQHFIHTRHNSAGGSTNNAIDFYVSDGTQYNTVTSGSTHVMSLNSGNVGVGTTTPGRKLDVQGGGIRVSGLSSANQLVISDADGDLVNISSLVGTGMGDNLGNHTATTTLNMNNNEIDNINYLDMRAGNGYGLRFWSDNNYKISMGNSVDYRYGDVQDYSIKSNMNNDAEGDRGWTWGVNGTTPVASISSGGHMTLNGSLFLDCVNCGSTSDPYPIGGSGWGDMVIQGRVMSTNSNLHLSPPGGSNVVINDTYRAAGGTTTGTAGLEIERLAGGGNRIVMADNSGVLYAIANLNSTGLGDNLGNHTATTSLNMNSQHIINARDIVVNDYGRGLVGLYSSTRYQNVFAMGAAYRLAPNGTAPGNLYGIAWTHSNVGGESINGLGHQALFMSNGDTRTAVGDGVWTKYASYFPIIYDQNDGNYYLDPNSTSDAAERIRGGSLHGPNVTWGDYLMVGGNGRQNYTNNTTTASVATTDGNLHMDAASGHSMYLNYYDGDRIYFGRGNNSNRALLDGNGLYLYDGWLRPHGNNGLYFQSHGGGWHMTDATWIRAYNGKAVLAENEIRSTNNMRAPIFYDLNDGNYYTDPNSWSRQYGIGSFYLRNNYDVSTDHPYGMYFANGLSQAYAIYRESGGWSWPYPDLMIRFHTGIKLSAEGSYGGVRIYANNGETQTAAFDNNGLTMWRDIRLQDYNVWDVNNLTVNTIYSEDANGTGADVVNIIDRLRVDLPSGQDFYVSNDDGRTTLRTQSANHGQLGRIQNYWYSVWAYYHYAVSGYYYFSDRSVKENLRPLSSASTLDKLLQLKAYKYDIKPGTAPYNNENPEKNKDHLGFIAQDLQKLFPELVSQIEGEDLLTVDYGKVTPILVEAIKEQQLQIDALKSGKPVASAIPKTQAQEDGDVELSEVIRKLIETTEKQQQEIESLKSKLELRE